MILQSSQRDIIQKTQNKPGLGVSMQSQRRQQIGTMQRPSMHLQPAAGSGSAPVSHLQHRKPIAAADRSCRPCPSGRSFCLRDALALMVASFFLPVCGLAVPAAVIHRTAPRAGLVCLRTRLLHAAPRARTADLRASRWRREETAPVLLEQPNEVPTRENPVACERRRPAFLNQTISLCLSRACLGKVRSSITN